MATIVLREADVDDLPSLSAISVEARQRYRSLPRLARVVDSAPVSMERLKAGRACVACDGRSILGFALTTPLDGLLFLDNISVSSAASGRGIGVRLLHHVVGLARHLDLPAVALTTFRTPPWNGPWFKRHGFEPMADAVQGAGLRKVVARQSKYLDPGMREVLWRKI